MNVLDLQFSLAITGFEWEGFGAKSHRKSPGLKKGKTTDIGETLSYVVDADRSQPPNLELSNKNKERVNFVKTLYFQKGDQLTQLFISLYI